jgi:lipoprotein NlpI
MEREGKMRDDVDGGISLLMNLSSAELELSAAESKLSSAESELINNEAKIKEKEGLISGYVNENKRLSTFVEKLEGVLPSLQKILKRIYEESFSPEMLVEAGEVCFSLGIYENANYFFEKALNIEPGSSDALNNLGVMSSRNGDFDMARDYFMRSLDHDPENDEAKMNLAMVSDMAGMKHVSNSGT